MIASSLAPAHRAAGALLRAAGGFNFVRLVRWRGDATLAEPIVWIIQLGYLWLTAGLVLTGLSVVAPGLVPASAGIHALTAGKIEIAICFLVNTAALARVVGSLLPCAHQLLLMISAGLWSAAFLAFCSVMDRCW